MKIKPLPKSRGVSFEITNPDENLLEQASVVAVAPFKLKKILLPTDFSLCSQQAVKYAARMAEQFGASLTMLTVIPPVNSSDLTELLSPVNFVAEEQRLCQKRLKTMARQEVAKTVPVEICVRVGHAASEIIQTARDGDIDLIIIATHGRTGLKHMLMGSVAEQVVRYAGCPVLVVRDTETVGQSKSTPVANGAKRQL